METEIELVPSIVPRPLADTGVFPAYKAAHAYDAQGVRLSDVVVLLSLVIPRAELVRNVDTGARFLMAMEGDPYDRPVATQKLCVARYYVAAIELAGSAHSLAKVRSVKSTYSKAFEYEAGRVYEEPAARSFLAEKGGCGPGLYFYLSKQGAFCYGSGCSDPKAYLDKLDMASVSVAITNGSVPSRLALAGSVVSPGAVVLLSGQGDRPAIMESVDLYRAKGTIRLLQAHELGMSLVARKPWFCGQRAAAVCDVCCVEHDFGEGYLHLSCSCILHARCGKAFLEATGTCLSCGRAFSAAAAADAEAVAAAADDDLPLAVPTFNCFEVELAELREAWADLNHLISRLAKRAKRAKRLK